MTLYLTPELHEQLKRTAIEQKRSLNKQALFFLEKGALHLEECEKIFTRGALHQVK